MIIRNKTRGTVLTENASVARTFAEKITGLLKATEPKAMMFRTRWGIHTVGMRFPIDCAVCDGKDRVRKITKELKPGKFFMWNPLWHRLVELPAGTLDLSHTGIGDELEFREIL